MDREGLNHHRDHHDAMAVGMGGVFLGPAYEGWDRERIVRL